MLLTFRIYDYNRIVVIGYIYSCYWLYASKDVNYKVWKNKLDMWKIVSSIPPKEQGIIVSLQSIADNNKAEKAFSTLTVHDLNRETGLDVLIEKLDSAFKDEIVKDTYSI